MKYGWMIAIMAFSVAATDAVSARQRHRTQPRCVDRPYEFSWSFIVPGNAGPQPNGCAPPVYAYGKYVGQDPDPHIRFQLQRDPATGYSAHQN
jgi:hypothetical protein